MTDQRPDGTGPDPDLAPPQADRPPLDRSPAAPSATTTPVRSGNGLAILALLIPIASGLVFLSGAVTGWQALAVSVGTVVVTAILVAWDAARLGPRDRNRKLRGDPGGLLLGMLFLWVFVYPLAYFRRRHFTGPNLGPLAIVVALFSFGSSLAPVLTLIAGGPPSCTSPEVIAKVEELARQFYGPDLESLGEFTERSYNAATRTRFGRCVAETDMGAEDLDFQVRKRGNGLEFLVLVPPPRHPPRCDSPQVLEALKQLAVQLRGKRATIEEPRQISYSLDRAQRSGECLIRNGETTDRYRFTVRSRDIQDGKRDFEVRMTLHSVPQLQDPKVVEQLETMLKGSPWGRELESISRVAEESFDPEANVRLGRASARLRSEAIDVGLSVTWRDQDRGLFYVQAWPLELPSVRNAHVASLLEARLRQQTPDLERIDGLEEVSYDRERQVREGRCTVQSGTARDTVRFRLQWLDRPKTYALLLDSDLRGNAAP